MDLWWYIGTKIKVEGFFLKEMYFLNCVFTGPEEGVRERND